MSNLLNSFGTVLLAVAYLSIPLIVSLSTYVIHKQQKNRKKVEVEFSDSETEDKVDEPHAPTDACQSTSVQFPEIEMQPMKRSQSMPRLHSDVPEFSHHSESDSECW